MCSRDLFRGVDNAPHLINRSGSGLIVLVCFGLQIVAVCWFGRVPKNLTTFSLARESPYSQSADRRQCESGFARKVCV